MEFFLDFRVELIFDIFKDQPDLYPATSFSTRPRERHAPCKAKLSLRLLKYVLVPVWLVSENPGQEGPTPTGLPGGRRAWCVPSRWASAAEQFDQHPCRLGKATSRRRDHGAFSVGVRSAVNDGKCAAGGLHLSEHLCALPSRCRVRTRRQGALTCVPPLPGRRPALRRPWGASSSILDPQHPRAEPGARGRGEREGT